MIGVKVHGKRKRIRLAPSVHRSGQAPQRICIPERPSAQQQRHDKKGTLSPLHHGVKLLRTTCRMGRWKIFPPMAEECRLAEWF